MAALKDSSLTQPQWGTDQVAMNDFLMNRQVPCVAKVVKGQFMNIGVSKFSPLKKLHQEVLVHSIKTGFKILGHSVARIDSRDGRTRLMPLEQRLSIPLTYRGWFELVSENGRSAKPFDSVIELAKAFPGVNNVLVRQNIKAYIINESDGKLTFDTTRVVMAGEQLKVIGDFTMQTPSNIEGRVRMLKCVDGKGDNAYLSFDQKGMFTPIANFGDITGVFLIKDVLHRFRLPLTVKLVQGVWPKVDSNRFTGLIRLDWAYTEETAFVCPLDRNIPRIFPIPTEVNLRFVTATNNNDLRDNEAFNNIMVKCNRLVANYHNTIHLIIAVPENALKAKSHALANIYSEKNSQSIPAEPPKSQMKRSKSKEDILLEELDDLYGYLREGKQPPVGKYTRTRDSDEETYYEEPEFEPMTKFKSRLEMLDRGDVLGSQKNTKYNFVDPRSALDANHNRVSGVTTVKVTQLGVNGSPEQPSVIPPELPPRLYKRVHSSPQIQTLSSSPSDRPGSGRGSADSPGSRGKATSAEKTKRTLHRRTSKESMSNSKSSGSDGKKDTDSKENRSSKSGSSKNKTNRKTSMPLLYL